MTDAKKHEIQFNEPYETYRQNKALGSTDIKNLLKSTRHFWDQKYNPDFQKDTACMRFGRLVHTLVLEPESFADRYAIYEDRRAGEKYKKFITEHRTQEIITQKESAQALKIVDAISGSSFAPYLKNAYTEVSVYGELDGIACKGRLDAVSHDKRVIFDLKTMASIEKVQSICNIYAWHIQSYLYSRLFMEAMKSDTLPIFIFISIDKTTNYVAFFQIGADSEQIAGDEIKQALTRYKEAMTNKIDFKTVLPYATKPILLELPAWRLAQANDLSDVQKGVQLWDN